MRIIPLFLQHIAFKTIWNTVAGDAHGPDIQPVITLICGIRNLDPVLHRAAWCFSVTYGFFHSWSAYVGRVNFNHQGCFGAAGLTHQFVIKLFCRTIWEREQVLDILYCCHRLLSIRRPCSDRWPSYFPHWAMYVMQERDWKTTLSCVLGCIR